MPATGWPRPSLLELGWAALVVACLVLMILSPPWETIPFHVIWISLTLFYGFRVWRTSTTAGVLVAIAIGSGALILRDTFDGKQPWGELFEVPLLSAMFLAMVWHARRRVQALATAKALADERASLLEQEERLLHDVSHELRTPVTIARGHLELLQRRLDAQRTRARRRVRRTGADGAHRRTRAASRPGGAERTGSCAGRSRSSRSSKTC